MFGFLKRIFKTGKNSNGMRFDVVVYSQDEDGNFIPKQENGVHANSPRELQAIYAACDQRVEILNSYPDADDPTRAKNREIILNKLKRDGKITNENERAIRMSGGENLEGVKSSNPQPLPPPNPHVNQPQQIQNFPTPITNTPQQPQVQYIQTPAVQEKTQYFTIGNVQCKRENGKVYQKEWVTVAAGESTEYRILNEKTNGVITMKGKIIQQNKWVQVQEDENAGN